METEDPAYRLDKTVFSFTTLEEQGNDLEYWLTKTPAERLAVMEHLRRINYGEARTSARLQRVLEIVELSQS